MKSKPRIAAALAVAVLALAPPAAFAQQKDDKRAGSQKPPAGERLEPDDRGAPRPGVPEAALANRRERIEEEEAAAVPYYNNFLTSYPLGPEDVISIRLFGTNLERYNVMGITVPPDGRVNYYFVKGGLHVAGKTTQQIEEELAHHLDEYIIEPKVMVTLEKAVSAQYGVIGDVAHPGIRQMTRRLSVYEAISQAGGILPTGKKQVFVLHWNADRTLRQIPIDVAAIQKGKAPDNYFLSPGDQIFVPGNKWKRVESVIKLAPILSFARIFTGGF